MGVPPSITAGKAGTKDSPVTKWPIETLESATNAGRRVESERGYGLGEKFVQP